MLKKIAIALAILIVMLAAGVFFWARAGFQSDTVRLALADQLSKALGQPVKVGSISATIYPRLTVNLDAVAIGEPSRIQIKTLHVCTDFRALLSRRIEHDTVHATHRERRHRIQFPGLDASDVRLTILVRSEADDVRDEPDILIGIVLR